MFFLLHFSVGKSRIYEHDDITNVTESLFPVPVKSWEKLNTCNTLLALAWFWEWTLSYYWSLDDVYIDLYWRVKFFIYTAHSLYFLSASWSVRERFYRWAHLIGHCFREQQFILSQGQSGSPTSCTHRLKCSPSQQKLPKLIKNYLEKNPQLFIYNLIQL